VVESRLHEEDAAKRALAELYDLGVDHPDFDARLDEFEEAVIRHATREENEEFVRLRETLDSDQLRWMAGRYASRRRRRRRGRIRTALSRLRGISSSSPRSRSSIA
jgi:hypothetical protein